MEYRSLNSFQRDSERIPLRFAIGYAVQIAQQLAALHEQGIVYSRLNPRNIRLRPDYGAQLAGTELASAGAWKGEQIQDAELNTEPSNDPEVLGYMSPEQLMRHRPDERSDVFSLGAVLYELISGRPAFVLDSANETFRAVLEEMPPPLKVPSVWKVVKRCLDKNPSSRYENAVYVASALEDLVPLPIGDQILHLLPVPIPGGVVGLTWGLLSSLILGVGYIWQSLPSPPPAAAPATTNRLTALFSAAWFTDVNKSPDSIDVATDAQPVLRVGQLYQLRFAIRDREFPRPPGIGGTFSAGSLSPPEALRIGDSLQVSYSGEAFDPSSGSQQLEVPERGGHSIVSFPVTAMTAHPNGSPVRLSVRFRELPFYSTVLTPSIVADGQRPPPLQSPPWTTDAHTVDPSALSNYAPPSSGDVVILVTPSQGDSRFSIRIDWIGRELAEGKSGFTPNELRNRLDYVRRQLDAIFNDPALKDDLHGEHTAVNTRARVLRRLAVLGAQLHNQLFQEPKLRALLEKIKAYSLTHTPVRVSIEHAVADDPAYPKRLMLPFGLLYDDPAFRPNERESGAVDVSHFWDYRYLLQFVDSRMMYKRSTLCIDGPIRVAAAMDVDDRSVDAGWTQQIKQQRTALEASRGRFVLSWFPDEDHLRTIFQGNRERPFDMIYYYGHTDSGAVPSFNLTGNALTLDQITDDIRRSRDGVLNDNPIVILNSCRGAAFSGDSYNTFLDVLGNLQASAFVGTEGAMDISYGAVIGSRLIEELRDSRRPDMTLVLTLWSMKRKALDAPDGNPLLMLYSVFGDPFIHVCAR